MRDLPTTSCAKMSQLRMKEKTISCTNIVDLSPEDNLALRKDERSFSEVMPSLSDSDHESSELDSREALVGVEENYNIDEVAPAPPRGPLAASGQTCKNTREKMPPSLHFRTLSCKLRRTVV